MDKMSNQKEIPDVIAQAYELLLQHRIVEITEPIQRNPRDGTTDWAFKCIVQVPYPNQENLPSEVLLRVSIPEVFPYAPIDIYPLCEDVRGFPHQDAIGLRRLCLHEERLAPRDPSRLVCYVKWAIKWFKDAANGILLKSGDPYELPDFRHTLLDLSLPTKSPLIFEESLNSYKSWKSYISSSGNVECFLGEGISAIFAVKFCDKDGSVIRKSDYTQNILKKDSKIKGRWITVQDIRYERHRPPHTYEEIVKLCSANGVDFYRNLRTAWNLENPFKFGILLIGFPIPKIVGQDPTEIHWQPLFFENYNGSKKRPTKRRTKSQSSRQNQIWEKLTGSGGFSPSQPLPWGNVENIARERLYVRGAHPSEVQSASIALFGCGALGSSVAELLARGGVKRLNLFDSDSIAFGNLCRHTLDGSSIGLNKAEELAERLSRANPLSTIKGHDVRIPLNSRSDETIHKVLVDADVFVDCTANETAFDWLNKKTVEIGKRLISLSFNLRAELLTICISGDSISCGDIFLDLNRSVQKNRTRIDPRVYFHELSEEEEIMEGAGCWHSTFPAQNTHIQILAAHAVDIINHSISSKSKRGLAAIVERQSVLQSDVQLRPLVKIAWKKEY